jgi:hypothetical protein
MFSELRKIAEHLVRLLVIAESSYCEIESIRLLRNRLRLRESVLAFVVEK